MQYILTEEEYRELSHRSRVLMEEHNALLLEKCTKIADTVKIPDPFQIKGRPPRDPQPWGCIITKAKRDPDNDYYCDHCPVRDVCPSPHKNYSK